MNAGEQHYDVVYAPLGATAMGGAERSILELAAAVAKRGQRVLVLAGPDLAGTAFGEFAERLDVALEWVDWGPSHGFRRNLKAALAVARKYSTPVYHFNMSWLPWMWLVPAAVRLRTRACIISTMRAMPDPHDLVPRRKYFGIVPGLQMWHLPEVLVGWIWGRLAHRTICINAKDFPRRLVSDYGYPKKRLGIIYNGIDTRSEPASRAEIDALRRSLGSTEENIVLCFVGRLSAEKGILDLLEAMTRLPAEYRLWIVGDGPQAGELGIRIKALRLENRVALVGFQSTPAQYMAASDIVVVPSTWAEAFGRVVIEAMNERRPVVASRVGGMAELFEDGVHGKFFPPGDVDRLAEAILSLGRDRAQLHALGEHARTWVEQHYSIARVEQQYLEEYARCRSGR